MDKLRLGHVSEDEAKALQDEEPNATKIERILSIKAIIKNGNKKSDMQMVQLLRQLYEMNMTKENLEETKIGLTVGRLQYPHQSMVVRKLSQAIIDEWKIIVKKWVISQPSRSTRQKKEKCAAKKHRKMIVPESS
ncbi:uncharacterized protein LOC127264474 [Andrographis paniculata]|uniref:uncharacterized protein LOC127264474 n=1 Tax=Andrographis paniculata TaxID=175694 RepID=UPI0021E6DD2F|nr:uncharacterized protein LOC127264474 [Andrographis paniculata]